MYSVQCTVYSVQCTVYSVQCTINNNNTVQILFTFSSERVSLVGLEEGAGGRGRPQAIHLPALYAALPLAAGGQTAAGGPRQRRAGHRRCTGFLHQREWQLWTGFVFTLENYFVTQGDISKVIINKHKVYIWRLPIFYKVLQEWIKILSFSSLHMYICYSTGIYHSNDSMIPKRNILVS